MIRNGRERKDMTIMNLLHYIKGIPLSKTHMDVSRQKVKIDYTNWRGIRSDRTIVPIGIYFGKNMYHTREQWLLEARDIEKNEIRIFAMEYIHSFESQNQ